MHFESIDSSTIRTVIRTYLIVVTGLTGWIAKLFLETLAKYRVAKGVDKHIPLTHVLGGLDEGLDLLTGPWALRALPRGRFGYFLMAFLWSLGKAIDLLNNKLVVDQMVPSRCPFGNGLVFEQSSNWTYPPFNSRTLPMIQNAQWYAMNNSCEYGYGIYAKANTDPRFCPTVRDVLGSWNCTENGEIVSFDNHDIQTIADKLTSTNYLYNNSYSSDTSGSSNKSTFLEQLSLWSTSAAGDADGSLWNVKAAVQMEASAVRMRPFVCNMVAPSAELLVRNMNSLTTLDKWSGTFQGMIYWGSKAPMVPSAADELAMLLNSMVMIAAGSDNMINEPAPGMDTTQGCLGQEAYVPTVLGALIITSAGILVALCVGTVVLMYTLNSTVKRQERKELDLFPNGVIKWAQLAVREYVSRTGQGQDVPESRDLKNFRIGFDGNDNTRVRISKRRDAIQQQDQEHQNLQGNGQEKQGYDQQVSPIN